MLITAEIQISDHEDGKFSNKERMAVIGYCHSSWTWKPTRFPLSFMIIGCKLSEIIACFYLTLFCMLNSDSFVCSLASMFGIMMIMAVKNQNGSMILTIIKVFAPMACVSMAINPAR